MSARATLLNFAKRAAKAPVRVTRRNMSGGGTIEEERGACATRGPALTAGRSRSVISDILGFPRGFSHARTVPGWTRASLDSSFASWMPQCGKPRWPNGRYRRRRPSRAGTPGRPVDVSLPHADWTPIQREGYTARPRLTGPVLPFPPVTAQLTWRSGGASPSSPCPGASASASTCSPTTTSTTRTSSRCVTAPTGSLTRRGPAQRNVSQNCAFSREPPLTPFPFPTIRQAYSYMRRRLKQLPWGGDCALFEYGKCQEN